MLVKAIYIQLFILGVILIWFGLSQRRSNKDLSLKIIAITLLLIGFWLGGVWIYPPYWALGVIGIVFAGLSVFKWQVTAPNESLPSSVPRTMFSNLPVLMIAPLGLYLGIMGVLGHGQNVEGLSVDLSSPFAPDQRACVISGGLSSLVNVHNFGNDVYGLDFIRLGPAGFRTRPGYRLNPKPSDYKAYNMYDTELYAPCTGRVVWVENSQIDQAIYRVNKDRPKANGVILACGTIHVKLAQMKMGSILVKQGDLVTSGDLIGRAGNSGNSEEPHLHIHAETAVEAASPQVQGEPVHMRFNGELLARGDCL